MFEAYTTTSTVYETDAAIAFTDIRYRDCRITTATPTSFRIVTPGRYYVEFHGVGASNTAASPFTVALYLNNVAVPGVETTITSTAVGDEQTLSLGTIINVAKDYFTIACGNGTALDILTLKPSGKNVMSAKDYINGGLKKHLK